MYNTYRPASGFPYGLTKAQLQRMNDMVPVGVLLIVLAVAFGAGFLGSSGESADIQFYGLKLQDLPARNLVILGIITGLILALGAESVRWGTARWRRRRRLARRRERELQAAVAQAGHREADSAEGSDRQLEKAHGSAVPSPESNTEAVEPADSEAEGDHAARSQEWVADLELDAPELDAPEKAAGTPEERGKSKDGA